MSFFTVVWEKRAEDELAELWLHNLRLRREITTASDVIDQLLAVRPLELGVETSPNIRQYVEPPLKVLFKVLEPDRLVRVLYVKLWED
jgi:hypothetical protein